MGEGWDSGDQIPKAGIVSCGVIQVDAVGQDKKKMRMEKQGQCGCRQGYAASGRAALVVDGGRVGVPGGVMGWACVAAVKRRAWVVAYIPVLLQGNGG